MSVISISDTVTQPNRNELVGDRVQMLITGLISSGHKQEAHQVIDLLTTIDPTIDKRLGELGPIHYRTAVEQIQDVAKPREALRWELYRELIRRYESLVPDFS